MRIISLAFFLSTYIAQTSFAQSCPGGSSTACSFSIYGFEGIAGSTVTCGSFVEASSNEMMRSQQKIYLSGFVSAANIMRARYLTIDIDGPYQYILNYCKQHPLEPSLTAFSKLEKDLGRGNAKVYLDEFKASSN